MHKILTCLFKFYYLYYVAKYKLRLSNFNGYMVRITGRGAVSLNNSSYISFSSRIHVEIGTNLIVGKNVSIGHRAQIYTIGLDPTNHIFGKKLMKKGDVIIHDNVVIGYNVFIGPNLTIGENSIIGANSVITTSIPSHSIVTAQMKTVSLK